MYVAIHLSGELSSPETGLWSFFSLAYCFPGLVHDSTFGQGGRQPDFRLGGEKKRKPPFFSEGKALQHNTSFPRRVRRACTRTHKAKTRSLFGKVFGFWQDDIKTWQHCLQQRLYEYARGVRGGISSPGFFFFFKSTLPDKSTISLCLPRLAK